MTNTPNPGDQAVEAVAVTQADRDAAAAVTEHWHHNGRERPHVHFANVQEGLNDDWLLVQAFARHRLSAIPTPPPADHTDLIARLEEYALDWRDRAVDVGVVHEAIASLKAATYPLGAASAEAIARIIEPDAWRAYDATLRPFAENRGGMQGEQFWYERAYRSGCRSVGDAKRWWRETADEMEPVQVVQFRESLRKAADALQAHASPREVEQVVVWLRKQFETVDGWKLSDLFALVDRIECGDHRTALELG